MKRKYDIAGSSDPEPDERKSKIARLSPRTNGINLGKKTLPADLELFLFSFLCADDFLALYLTSRDGAATVRDNLGQLKTLRLDWNDSHDFAQHGLPALLLLPRFCRSLVRVEEDIDNSMLDVCTDHLAHDRVAGWQCNLIAANSQTLSYYSVSGDCGSPTVLAALSLCPRLQTLDLSMNELVGVEPLVRRTLAQCPDIQTVWMCGERKLVDLVLGAGKHLRAVHDLTLEDGKQARLLFSEAHWGLEELRFHLRDTSLPVVAQSMPKLAALKMLSMRDATGRGFVDAVWALPALEELRLYECTPLPEIRAPQLRSVYGWGGAEAAVVERVLVHSRELRDVQVSGRLSAAGAMANASALTQALEQKLWDKLETLDLRFTVPAESLLHFGNLPSLEFVNLSVPANLPAVFVRRFLERLPPRVHTVSLTAGSPFPGPFPLPSDSPSPAELKQLQSLALPVADAALFTGLSFPALKTLAVNGGDLGHLDSVLASAPTLSSLILSNCTSQGFGGSSPAAARCRLGHVSIAGCAWFNVDQLVGLLRLCGHDLASLSVSRCANIGSEALAMIAAMGCPALSSLSFSETALMTPESVTATVLLQLIRCCPELIYLTLPTVQAETRQGVVGKLRQMGRADLSVIENGTYWRIPPAAAAGP